jgi:hypothetical protein
MSLSGDIDTAVATIQADTETSSVAATSATPDPSATSRAAAASPSATSAAVSGSETTPASTVPSPAPATLASATADDGEASGDGPIPLTRHQKILESARTKERERLTSIYGVNPDEWQSSGLAPIVNTLRQNPVAAYELIGRELRAAGLLKDPTPAARPSATAPTDELPQPKLRADDGSLVYTAEETAKLIQHFVDKATTGLRSEVEPLLKGHQQTQAESIARQQISEIAKEPYFVALKPEMIRLMQADRSMTIQVAYDRALRAYVPTIEQSTRAKTLAELTTAPVVPTQALAPGSTVVRGSTANGKRRPLDWNTAAKNAIEAELTRAGKA